MEAVTCSRIDCYCAECTSARMHRRAKRAEVAAVSMEQRITALEATVREQTKAHDDLRREFSDAIARLRQGWRP